MIPAFRLDGYLLEGVYIATEAELTFRFGSATPQRRRLSPFVSDGGSSSLVPSAHVAC